MLPEHRSEQQRKYLLRRWASLDDRTATVCPGSRPTARPPCRWPSYAPFATRHLQRLIHRAITDRDGVTSTHRTAAPGSLSPVRYLMTSLLKTVTARARDPGCPARYAVAADRTVTRPAAATGTYGWPPYPRAVVAVWMGYDKPDSTHRCQTASPAPPTRHPWPELSQGLVPGGQAGLPRQRHRTAEIDKKAIECGQPHACHQPDPSATASRVLPGGHPAHKASDVWKPPQAKSFYVTTTTAGTPAVIEPLHRRLPIQRDAVGEASSSPTAGARRGDPLLPDSKPRRRDYTYRGFPSTRVLATHSVVGGSPYRPGPRNRPSLGQC